MSEPYRGPDPQSWSSDDLDGLSPDERRRQVEATLQRALQESPDRVGALQACEPGR